MSEIKVSISESDEIQEPKKIFGIRHIQFIVMFFSLIIFFGIRTCLSVAIISMTEETPPDPSISTYPEWDNTDVILSSFFWGYIIPQVGAGQLSEYFGLKWFLVTTMTIGSIFHIIIPSIAAQFGSTGVMVCRMMQGLNQGFLFPSLHNLVSKWTPLFERARISSFVYGGSQIGVAISMPLTGAIAGSKMGWPVAFYLYGGLGIFCALVFAIFIENSPSQHRGISEEERNYIESSNMVTVKDKKMPTPWLSILSSPCIWAILLVGCSHCWGGFTLLTEIPTYMSSMMNFNIKDNSKLSALPYTANFFVGLISASLVDKIISRQFMSIGRTRKIFSTLGTFLPALALIYLAFVDKSQKDLATVLLVLAVSTTAFGQSAYLVNIIDVAPDHAGTLLGILNGTSNIFSILGPLTVGFLGSDKEDPVLWRKVFLLAAGVYGVAGLFYNFFASGEVQAWNNLQAAQSEEDNKKKKEAEANSKY